MATPNFFIATSEEAYEKVKQYATRGIVDLSTFNNDKIKSIGQAVVKITASKPAIL